MTPKVHSPTANTEAWRGFTPGLWQRDINVRWFIQQNYTPYNGDETFLSSADRAHAAHLPNLTIW